MPPVVRAVVSMVAESVVVLARETRAVEAADPVAAEPAEPDPVVPAHAVSVVQKVAAVEAPMVDSVTEPAVAGDAQATVGVVTGGRLRASGREHGQGDKSRRPQRRNPKVPSKCHVLPLLW